MMVLSRFWYVLLSLLLGMALYVVFLAVGQYNRRNGVAMTEELASDSQTVGWALQIDARKRLDALLLGAVDKGVQDALQSANGKDSIPAKTKDDGRRALSAVLEKIAADFRPDALFAVDHEGRVVAQVGYDAANAFPDFELGGYPVVFDALHGFLRDDTWVLGGKLYRVVARPVEFDATQPPLGAIVGMRGIDKKYAQDLSKRTRANIAFYAGGQRVTSSTLEGFDENRLTLVDADLPKLAGDKEYGEGRSAVRFVSDDVGVMYARLFGDAWDLGGGFVVARARVTIDGPLGFLNGADDKDKQSVNFIFIAAIVLGGILGGFLLSFLEQSMPMREMLRQGQKLRKGELDYFQLPRFRGSYRSIAQDVNAGIERVLEKGGAAVRKPADLESILGPVPAQPAMSAFSFPLAEAPAPRPPPPPLGGPAPASGGASGAIHPGAGGLAGGGVGTPASAPAYAAPVAPAAAPTYTAPASAPAYAAPAAAPTYTAPAAAPAYAAHAAIDSPMHGSVANTAAAVAGAAAVVAAGPAPATGGSPGRPAPPKPPSPSAPSLFSAQPARSPGPPGASSHVESPVQAAPAAVRPPMGSESGAKPIGFPPPKAPAAPRAGTMAGIGQQGQPTIGAAAMSPGTVPTPFAPPFMSPGATGASGVQSQGEVPKAVPAAPKPAPAAAPFSPPAPSRPQVATKDAPVDGPLGVVPPPTSSSSLSRQLQHMQEEAEDEATVVAAAPSELLAQSGAASGPAAAKAPNDTAEWMTVYDDFVRTKKQCGEPTEGLTFEKFQATLKKNRDALMQRHNCKRVRFSVYVKDGRASLKATPVRD